MHAGSTPGISISRFAAARSAIVKPPAAEMHGERCKAKPPGTAVFVVQRRATGTESREAIRCVSIIMQIKSIIRQRK